MPRKKEKIEKIEKVETGKEVETEKEFETKVEKVAKKREKRKKKEKKKIVTVSARRKTAIARARVKEGKGVVKINKFDIEAIQNPYVKEIIKEPLRLASDHLGRLSISVNVKGGGTIGQAQAARTAIARGIVEYTGDDDLKRTFLGRDRFLLVEDVRMVEPKKYKGRKARARFQKSYR